MEQMQERQNDSKTDENGNVYNAEYKVDEDDKKDDKK